MRVRRQLVTVTLGVLLVLCVGRTAWWLVQAAGRPLPVALEVPRYAWLASYLHGHESIGLLCVDMDVHPASLEARLALHRAQQAAAPTWILRQPGATSLVMHAPSLAEADVRRRLSAHGYNDVRFGPTPGIALASQGELEQHDGAGLPPAGWLRTLLVLAALTLPALVAARASGRAGWLMLLGLPCLLGIAAAAGDLTPAPVAVTAACFAGLAAGWFRLIAPLGAGASASASANASASASAGPASRTARWPLVATTILGLVAIALAGAATPEGGWDANAMYLTHARFIVLADAFATPFAANPGARELHTDYPPLIAFAVAGGWRLAGGVIPLVAIWVQLCFLLGFVGLLVGAAKSFGSRVSVTALALLLAAPRVFERVAGQECDLPLGCLVGAAVLLLLADPGGRPIRLAVVIGVLAGWTLLTKNEGSLIVLVAVVLLAVWLARQRAPAARRAPALGFLGGLLPGLLLLLAFKAIAPPNDLVLDHDWQLASLTRARQIASRFLLLACHPGEFQCVFVLVAPLAIVAAVGAVRGLWWRDDRSEVRPGMVAIGLVVVLSGFFLVYLVTPYDLAWHLSTSATRVLFGLYPTAVAVGVCLAGRTLTEPECDRQSGAA